MTAISGTNFGLLIAYVLPGFTALVGTSYASPTLRTWLAADPTAIPTIAGFLYTTLAAITAGLVVSTMRWAVLDTLFHVTGVPRPQWDFRKLRRHGPAFQTLEENHYRFYQFYGGMLFALAYVEVMRWVVAVDDRQLSLVDGGIFSLMGMFLLGARDSARKYFARAQQLLGSS